MLNEKQDLLTKAESFYDLMKTRKSCRHFTNEAVPIEVLKTCILTAGSAPSGANKQPWFFSIITDPELKRKIRHSAEKEEFEFYTQKASDTFLNDLKPFETDWTKPHLTEAAALIVIFSKSYELIDEKKSISYYAKESVGIATGILITALHQLGLATLTHTPNPMRFLNEITDRPANEKPFLILAVGYRDQNSKNLELNKKSFDEIGAVL
jgi:iodotyrosine deiodinase